METLDLANNPDKVKAFQDFVFKIRDDCGGIIMHLVIPPSLKSLMHNLKTEEGFDETNEFYLWGWYDGFKFTVYVDKTLIDSVIVFCNYKAAKIKVLHA